VNVKPVDLGMFTGTHGDVAVIVEFASCNCHCGCAELTVFPLAGLHAKLRDKMRCLNCSVVHADESIHAAAVAADRAAKVAEDVERWRGLVPARFKTASTDHPKIQGRVERFKTGAPGGILTAGPYGSGKTFIAYAYLNTLVGEGLVSPGRVLFGTENDLLGRVSTASFQDRQKALDRLLNPRWDVVFVDDVGWGKYFKEEDRFALFHDLFDFLWANRKTLVMTTNLTKDSLKEWVGSAAYDRMIGLVGGEQVIVSIDESLRRKGEEVFERSFLTP
jgi:DNA replication protein DnaC